MGGESGSSIRSWSFKKPFFFFLAQFYKQNIYLIYKHLIKFVSFCTNINTDTVLFVCKFLVAAGVETVMPSRLVLVSLRVFRYLNGKATSQEAGK